MRLLAILGIVLIVLGTLALGYQGITFFTHDTVADVGPVHVTMERPHTLLLHPAVGAASLAVGLLLFVLGMRRRDA